MGGECRGMFQKAPSFEVWAWFNSMTQPFRGARKLVLDRNHVYCACLLSLSLSCALPASTQKQNGWSLDPTNGAYKPRSRSSSLHPRSVPVPTGKRPPSAVRQVTRTDACGECYAFRNPLCRTSFSIGWKRGRGPYYITRS